MKKVLAGLSLLLACGAGAAEWEDGFADPPQTARPQAWWWWLNTPTSRAAITRDLEEMKAKGFSGCHLLDGGVAPFGSNKWKQKTVIGETGIRYEHTGEYEGGTLQQAPEGMEMWSPAWREMVRFASLEAGRLGLEFGVFIGPAGCGAPWVTPEYGQQELVWSATPVKGAGSLDQVLPRPGKKSAWYRDVAVIAVPANGVVREVIDLRDKMDGSGRLQWTAPQGAWTVLRFGQQPTGRALKGAYYIDHLSTEAFDRHWEHTVGLLLKEMTPAERKAFKYVECDSWEAGTPTWTKSFPEEFANRRGYDLLDYLPVLAGRTVKDETQSARFKYDYDLTIGDLIAENHYAYQRTVAHAHGLLSCAEAAGPHQVQADLLKSVSRCDIAMGEFWMPSPHRPTPEKRLLVREAASAAHVYGMNRVFAESFTSVGPQWEESPFLMKAAADQAFCDGLNWICFHTFTHRPSVDDVPGLTHSAGTHFDRTVTWWDQSAPFITYLARCSYLLQQGLFVADVLMYRGDGIKAHGGPAREDGLKNPPASLGAGFDYDYCNNEVLLTRLDVKDGQLVLPDGMAYRVLVLPEGQPLSPAAREKVEALKAAGATVVDDRAIRERLARMGVGPDFECSGVSEQGVIDFIHRRSGDADLYFVASRWQPVERVVCSFRVSGKQPELWDPVTGTTRELPEFRQENGRTIVPLEFAPCGSAFLVFRKPVAAAAGRKNGVGLAPVAELDGAWQVAFDPKWGGPAMATFESLVDWTQRPEPGIKYYSGKATYRQRFDAPAAALPSEGGIYLDLGNVRELAAVRLNGVDLGVLWTKPFRVEISSVLKPTGNQLEIEVVNLWPNRLIGDEFLPEAERFTKTNIRKFTRQSALLPSGLLGPVRLLRAVP